LAYNVPMVNDGKPGAGPGSAPRIRDSADAGARADDSPEVRDLTSLVDYLQTTYETERSTLAKELHDELGGLITAVKMDMQWLSQRIGASLDTASDEKLRAVMQMLNQAMVLKRRVVETLRPSLLDHFGLPVALRSHFDENCRKAGIECVTSLPDESVDLPAATQLSLFRVAQEALSDVLARGTAKHVELVVDAVDGGYTMLIGDDGNSDDAAASQALVAIRYRVERAGGSFERERAPGQGNRIRVFVPRSPAESG